MKFTLSLRAAFCLSSGIISSVAADVLTTFSPCLSCPSSVMPPVITVTEQYQTVSTCTPTTTCKPTTASVCTLISAGSESCSTHTGTTCEPEYSYSTFEFVSTVIPCSGIDPKIRACTVTATEELITVNHISTTVTSYTTILPSGSGYYRNTTSSVAPVVKVSEIDVIVIDYVAPYNDLGPLAIWGYGGSGLCKECGPAFDGSLVQVVDVHKCINDTCTEYKETWSRGPTTTSIAVTQTFSTSYSAATNGVHTVTVEAAACTTTSIANAPTTLSYPGTTQACETNGVYTVTVAPAVYSTAIVDNAPTTISLASTTYACSTNGVYTITISPESYHTTTIVNAPTTVYYPSTTAACPTNGQYTITVAPPVAITTSISNCPTTVLVTKTVTRTIIVGGCPSTSETPFTSSSVPPAVSASTTGAVSGVLSSTSSTSIISATVSLSSSETETEASPTATPNPSSDPDPVEPAITPRAAVLTPKFASPQAVRRGGVLRSPMRVEEKRAVRNVRDFSIKKRELLS